MNTSPATRNNRHFYNSALFSSSHRDAREPSLPQALLQSSAAASPSCPCLRCLNTEWSALDWSRPGVWALGRKGKRSGPQTQDSRELFCAVLTAPSPPHPPEDTSPTWDVWGNQLSVLPGGPFSLWVAVMDLLGPPAHFTVRDVSALCAPDGRGALHPQELHKWSPVPHDSWHRKEGGSPRPGSPSGLGGTVWNSWPKGTFCSTSHRERDLFPLPMHPELEQVSETFWSSRV